MKSLKLRSITSIYIALIWHNLALPWSCLHSCIVVPYPTLPFHHLAVYPASHRLSTYLPLATGSCFVEIPVDEDVP